VLKINISFCFLVLTAGLRAQTPTISAVVNGASYSSIVSPGALVAIFGADFGSAPIDTLVDVGGLRAPVLFASSTQLNVQLPFDLPPGPTMLTVSVHGRTSAAVSLMTSQYAPAVFVDNRQGVGIFENNFGLITPANPAIPGDTIVAYTIGLGETKPSGEVGEVTVKNTVAACVTLPTVTVGGMVANVIFAGPSPGFAGVYQVKFVVPRVSAGRQDVVISIGRMRSPAVTLPVGVPGAELREASRSRATAAVAVASRTVQLPSTQLGSVAAPITALVSRVSLSDIPTLSSQPVSLGSVHGTIAYTCDPSINAVAGVCNTLNTTIAGLYASTFTNANANIYITFGNTGLGQSLTELNLVPYSSYRSALIASESSANDMTAVTNSVPPANPFGSDVVALTDANARALGYSAAPGLSGADNSCCYDGIITISSAMESSGGLYFRTGSIGPGQYDFYSVVEHETDEVLGTASCAFGCNFGSTVAFSPVDLFRYHSNGTRSFAPGNNNSCLSSNNANGCFSIDGVHMLRHYNNLNNGEDAGDWAPNCANPLVQNSEACPGVANLDISPAAEIEVLDVVGFTLPSCTYSLSSNSASVGAGASIGMVSVVAGGGCAWTASSNASWLTITSGSSGNGNGTVKYSFMANSGTTARSGTLTIAGQTFTVMQAASPSPLGFYSLTPCRIADTRSGSGFSGPFGPPFLARGAARSFPIPTSSCNVPAGVQAYSLNITVVPHGSLSYLTAWATGTAFPGVSTLNSLDGHVVANAAIVQAGTSAAISLYASDDTDVFVDINGYFAAPGAPQGLVFYPVTPCRIADTRSYGGKTGAFGPPQMTAFETRAFPIASSSCGIPATAQAYSLNMTVWPARTLQYLTTWGAGQTQPLVSTLNAYNGGLVANAAIVPAGIHGDINVFVTDPTDVIVDIDGYFAPPGSPGALYFYPLMPCRVADTRSYGGMTGAFGPPTMIGGSTRDFPMLSSSCGIPGTAQAYSLNMTVWPSGPMQFLTTWPAGQPFPLVSTLNSPTGRVVANAAIVPAGVGGNINVYVSDTTDVFFDISGYFAP
jgi:uncharacterized protein (TIGR03437 family)